MRSRLKMAVDIVSGLGYREVFPEYLGVAAWFEQAANHHVHLEGGSTGRLVVEIHWNLIAGDIDPRTPASAWFWSQTSPLGLAGTGTVLQLAAPAQLLYAAAHLMLQHKTDTRPLIWYYDFAQLD